MINRRTFLGLAAALPFTQINNPVLEFKDPSPLTTITKIRDKAFISLWFNFFHKNEEYLKFRLVSDSLEETKIHISETTFCLECLIKSPVALQSLIDDLNDPINTISKLYIDTNKMGLWSGKDQLVIQSPQMVEAGFYKETSDTQRLEICGQFGDHQPTLELRGLDLKSHMEFVS